MLYGRFMCATLERGRLAVGRDIRSADAMGSSLFFSAFGDLKGGGGKVKCLLLCALCS